MARFPLWVRALLGAVLCGLSLYYFATVLDRAYPIQQWLVWRLAVIWLWCLVFNGALLAFGVWLTGRIVGEATLPPLEAAVTSVAVGTVGMGLLLYAAGFLGLLHTWLVLALAAVLLGVGARPLWRLGKRLAAERAALSRPRTAFGRTLALVTIGWVAWSLTFLYLGAMTPDAINHDAAWYHLPTAADYARAGRIVPFAADYLRAMPHLMAVLYSWAFLVPGLPHPALRWMLVLHIEFSMVMWTLVGVAAGARWMLEGRRVPLLWAAFLLFPGIFVYDMHIGGSADHVLGMFTIPLFLTAIRAAERFETRRCLLFAILVAGAVLTKYQSLYLLAGCTAILIPRWAWLLFRRGVPRLRLTAAALPARRALLVGPVVIVLAGLALTAPHFLKNIVFYKNPIYPFAQETFSGSQPSFANSAGMVRGLLTDSQGLPQGSLDERLWEAVKTFFTFSFEPHYSFVGSLPVIGSLFTLLLPLALVVCGRRRIWAGVLFVFAGMMVWGTIQYADRYLQILTPLMAVVVGALLVRGWQLGWLARIALVPLVLLQVVWGGDIIFVDAWPRIQSAVNLIRSGFDSRRDDESRFGFRTDERQLGKALPPNAVLLLHSTLMNLGIDRPVLVDVVGRQGLLDYDQVADPRGLWELYHSLGITHLAHLPDIHWATENRAHDVLFEDFVTRFGLDRRRFGGFELVTVPDLAPPPERPYQVLALGINYQDGLYGIEQMQVHEAMQPGPNPLPPPRVPWPREDEARHALLGQANTVLIGAGYKLAPALHETLSAGFREAVEGSENYAIWVRR